VHALVHLARSGDREAFALLYASHVGLIRRYARRLAWDEQAADDLVADAFLRTWLQLLGGRGPEQGFGAYVRAAVLNIHLNQLAQRRRLRLVADIEVAGAADPALAARLVEHSPEDLVILGHLTARINEALLSLHPRWRAVLVLIYLEDRPYADVAASLGLTVSATQQLSLRARAGFRRALTQLRERDGEPDDLGEIAAFRQLHDGPGVVR
jgi:RNA polymerase sigma-70 factor (ECF subfamily)